MLLSATPNEDDEAPWPGLLLLDAAAAAEVTAAALVCRLGTANLSTYVKEKQCSICVQFVHTISSNHPFSTILFIIQFYQCIIYINL